jgi:2-dehydropantoate 2-reductase
VVAKNGWVIRSCDGDFSLGPDAAKAYEDVGKMPKADLVIVTLKATANHQYGPLIAPLLKENTTILTLQNGLGNEDRLAELFGAQRILGGLAFVCINRVSPGVIHHLDHGLVRIGEFIEGKTEKAAAIVEMFSKCRIRCDMLSSLKYGRWEKLIWNIPFNGLGAALDLTTDRLIGSALGTEMVRSVMTEVIAAAAGQGVQLPTDLIEEKIDATRTMGAYKSSMQFDREMRRPLEVEAILGEPLRAAQRARIPTPNLQALYQMVCVVDRS